MARIFFSLRFSSFFVVEVGIFTDTTLNMPKVSIKLKSWKLSLKPFLVSKALLKL